MSLEENNYNGGGDQCLWGSWVGILKTEPSLAGGQARRLQNQQGRRYTPVQQMPGQQLPSGFSLMWYMPAQWMKGQAHFTNLKDSFQVLHFHVGRKAETIADIVASLARVGQIRSEDEGLEAQGLCPPDQLPGSRPVAVDVELEPAEAAGRSRGDLLQRAGGVGAGNVAGVHCSGRLGGIGKESETKASEGSCQTSDTKLCTVCRDHPKSWFHVYLTKHRAARSRD